MRLPKKYRIPALFFLLILFGIPGTLLFSRRLRSDLTNRRFLTYTDSLFRAELQQNALNLHYTLSAPENMQISRYNYSLGSFPTERSPLFLVRQENCRRHLQNFPDRFLNRKNRLAKEILLSSCELQLSSDHSPLLEEPLSPSLGCQAQLPILLAEYTFRREQDVIDYLKILENVAPYFRNLLLFEQKKSEQGLFMSDTTADHIIRQCSAFIADPEDNYLDAVFQEKIRRFSGFSKDRKEELQHLHTQILRQKVIPAYQSLIDGLKKLKGTGRNTGGLCRLPGGKSYYEFLLKSSCGLSEPVSDMKDRLLRQLQTDLEEARSILASHPDLQIPDTHTSQPGVSASSPDSGDPLQILSQLEKAIARDFPALQSTSYEVKYVHKALEAYLSPAFYLTPPVDTLQPNTIYINRYDAQKGSSLFSTLAHEGFPGHLYQYSWFSATDPPRIRYLFSSGGYVEGWATYVESWADSCAPQADDLSRLQWLNHSANLCIASLLDIGIHYDGWDPAQAARFLSLLGIRDSGAQEQLYQAIVEDPSNYLKYTMGYLHFLDLREKCRKKAGASFHLKEFHQHILETGPCPFSILEKQVLSCYEKPGK